MNQQADDIRNKDALETLKKFISGGLEEQEASTLVMLTIVNKHGTLSLRDKKLMNELEKKMTRR